MKNPCDIRAIDSERPQSDLIAVATDIILDGGVVVFPTRGLYGLGADATRPEAVSRVFEIKNRPRHKPLPVLIADRKQVADWVTDIPPAADMLMTAFWPGRITLVLKSSRRLPSNLTAGHDRLGLRLPGHAVARDLVRAVGRPITATSANVSGAPGCHRIEDIPADLLNRVDLVLDAGPLAGGAGSTVVDIRSGKVVLLREGAVSAAEIEQNLGVKLQC